MLAIALALLLGAADPAGAPQGAPPLTAGEKRHAAALEKLDKFDFAADSSSAPAEIARIAAPILADPAAGDAARAAAIAAIGYAKFYNYDYAAALESFAEARRLYERAGRDSTLAYAALVSETGSALTALDRPAEALAMLELGVAKTAAAAGLGSSAHSAAIFALGNVKFRNGDIRGGIERFEQSVRFARANEARGTPDDNFPIYLMSVAALLDRVGEMERSLTYAAEAASLAETRYGADHNLTLTALHNLGSLLNHANRYAEAEPVLRRALDARSRQLGPDHSDTAMTMHNLAKLLHKTGRYEEAEALYASAITIFDANPDVMSRETVGEMQLNRAAVAEAAGALDRALELRRAALERLRKDLPPEHRSIGTAELAIARTAFLTGDHAAAAAGAERALAILAREQSETEPTRFTAAVLRAFLRIEGDQREAAQGEALALAHAIEVELTTPAAPGEERADRWTRYQEPLALLAQALLALDEREAAFRCIQLAQIAEIGDAANRLAARLAAGDGATAELLRRFQDDDEAARGVATRINAALAANDQAALPGLRAELATLRGRIVEASARLERLYPQRGFASVPRPAALADAQRRLGEGEAMLYALPRADAVLSVLVTRRGLRWSSNPFPRAALVKAVQALRDSVTLGERGLPAYDFAAAHRLYRASVPWSGRPPAIRHLAIQASGPLASVPFAALVTRPWAGDPRRAPWLVEAMAVSVPLPAADAPQLAHRAGALSFAGIGDPQLRGDAGTPVRSAALMRGGSVNLAALAYLPRLPTAGEELRTMLATFGGQGRLWTGAQATERALKAADLRHFRVLAFATHGLVEGDMAGLAEPALVLTPPGTASAEDDGLLTASEIARLRLDADWVILSACNTAAPSGVAQTTFSGLARAFVQAGARSLLLSHWPVRDDAAARLTVETVKGSAGGTDRAEALRRAQLGLIRDGSVADGAHPAIWAPYILVGE